MHCGYGILMRLQAEALLYVRPGCLLAKSQQRVDHHVADEEDAFVGHTFGPQVRNTRRFTREQIVRENVGDEAVQLLGPNILS